MKRGDLIRHLREHGCELRREGGGHSVWTNPANGALESIPRHSETGNRLERKIRRTLEVPEIVR